MIEVCEHCGHRFAEREGISNGETLQCPKCGEVVRQDH